MSPVFGRSQMVVEALTQDEGELLRDWMREQLAATTLRPDLMTEGELREQSREFLRVLREAVQGSDSLDPLGSGFTQVRSVLDRVSRERGIKGFTPSQTATFVLSLKQPLFARLRQAHGAGAGAALLEDVWAATRLLDGLGLYTTEVHQKTREEVIARQQEEMLELSTPVITLWKGILALPLIGTLDSHRTQLVMEALLQRIVETESEVAIIDITGVPTVDTMVAQHLMKAVTATRLMGADCIISGIRPQIAQTIVHLGVNLGDIVTKSTLAGAFQLALQKRGLGVKQVAASTGALPQGGLTAGSGGGQGGGPRTFGGG